MTPEKKAKYSPVRIRIVAASYLVIGILAVFGISLFMRSLGNLYQESGDLDSLSNSLDISLIQRDYGKQQDETNRKNLYIEYAQRIAELLERFPQLETKEQLGELSDIVGARYLMTFDAYGRQVSTSSDYINMELGAEDAEKPSSTADFRRILKGVPSIAHDAVRDEVTGRTLELIGVRINDLKNGGYGVLIMAMKPADEEDVEEEINLIMTRLTPAGKLCFSVDPDSGMIQNTSSDAVPQYATLESVGLREYGIHGGISDFVTILGKKYYCISKTDTDTGIIYYFCTLNEVLFKNSVNYALTCAIGFGIIFVLLCSYLLHGYTNKWIKAVEQQENTTSGEMKSTLGPGKLRTYVYHKWGAMTPQAKALLTLRVIAAGAILRLMYDYSTRAKQTRGIYVLDYIIGGKWKRGFNLFSLTAMVILFCGIEVCMFFIRFVLGTIGNMTTAKGKTICKLVANMIGYLSILIYLYYALGYVGVDTNAILASVGVIGIGLTMGARDLIADIFAGISLIFGGEYQVGDIVSIDGYRGMVQDVGVRTTKIKGRGGNVKTIGNKDIKNVINLTKLNSWVPITIRVDVSYPLLDVEQILAETLPRIGHECKEIISGPYYKGVLSVEAGFAVLSVIAECREENYHKVERTLVRDVLLALREKNVPVR